MPTRRALVRFAPPPCHRLPCQIRTLPFFISASFRHKEWDKTTGVFVGASEVYKNVTNKVGWYIDNLTVTVVAIATNMWSPELVPGLDQTVFFALVAASAVLVASTVCSLIVVTRRRRPKKLTSRFTSRGKSTV